jgi:hypothetical protein
MSDYTCPCGGCGRDIFCNMLGMGFCQDCGYTTNRCYPEQEAKSNAQWQKPHEVVKNVTIEVTAVPIGRWDEKPS